MVNNYFWKNNISCKNIIAKDGLLCLLGKNIHFLKEIIFVNFYKEIIFEIKIP